MHICLDARTVSDRFPGIGRYARNLPSALVALLGPSEQLTVLRDPIRQRHWNVTPLAERGAAILDLPLSPFSLRQQWRLPILLRRQRADLYHSPYYLVPWRSGIPLVVNIFDLIPLLDGGGMSPGQRRVYAAAVRMAARLARLVLTASRAAAADIQRLLHVPDSRLRVIAAAADPVFCPQPAERIRAVRSKLALPERYVLYVGTNKPHKNLVRLVEAWQRIPLSSVPLVLAGRWDPRYPESRKRTVALGLEDRVRFLGPIAEADLPALYSGATLAVVPSLHEGFGLPLIEAMACGAPVACARAEALLEVAGDASVLFDPADIESIATALATVLGDAGRRTELAARSLERATQFSWSTTARETLTAYREITT